MINTIERSLPIRVLHLGIMATALSTGVVIWQLFLHVVFAGESDSIVGYFVHALADTALLFPLSLFAIAVGLKFSGRLGFEFRSWHGIVGSASMVSVLLFLGAVPGVSIHGYSHGVADQIVEGFSESPSVNPDENMEAATLITKSNMSATPFHGIHDAAVSQIVVLPMMILGLFLLSKSGNLTNFARWPEPRKGSLPGVGRFTRTQ